MNTYNQRLCTDSNGFYNICNEGVELGILYQLHQLWFTSVLKCQQVSDLQKCFYCIMYYHLIQDSHLVCCKA